MRLFHHAPASILFFIIGFSVAVPAHEFSGPQGSVRVDWAAEHVRNVYSSGYGDSFGMEAAVKLGFPVRTTVEGYDCVEGSYLLFDIDDRFAFDIDETVELEVLIDRRASSGLRVSYDRNARAEPMFEVSFDAGSSDLVRQRIRLDRARFANRGEAHTDLMLAAISAYFPGIPDHDHRIVLCDLKIHRSNETQQPAEFGRLRLAVTDSSGQPVPARAGLYAQNGRQPLPSRDALPIKNYDDVNRQLFLRATHVSATPWPHSNRHVFYTDGHYSATIPVGTYTLVLSKGPEFRVHQQDVVVSPGTETVVAARLQRWSSMPASGWYSGDDHVHIKRHRSDNAPVMAIMQAEDIHLTNVLQMGNPASPYFEQYAMGLAGRYVASGHSLVPGVEDPRTALRGHTISLNIDEVIRDKDSYLLYDRVFARYRAQGGMSGYAHVAGDWFNVGRGLALDVPLGVVDFIEVLQDGELDTTHWYDILDLGFNVAPSAGSDFPYLNQPGAERVYVQVDGEFTADAWFDGLKAGKSFVTNGPMLELSANGAGIGATIDAEPGDTIEITAYGGLNPDHETLDRLELIVHGEVIASASNENDSEALLIRHTLTVEHGVWLALRATGRTQALAHSAPIFIVTDERGFRNDEKTPEIVSKMLARLAEYESLQVDIGSELEVWEVGEALDAMLGSQRESILTSVERAREVYQGLLDDVAAWH
ncbi:MAG: CehA/McbA family metallohydrolase [Gammaproteobacteria bacterium]|nr:CehA/McbA family metallohydrolase [Gammaproteobacteria bacterium]